jgi:integrase
VSPQMEAKSRHGEDGPMTRHRNENIRKICGCARSKWAKCAHPWHFNYTWQGVVCRITLERHVGRLVRSTNANGAPIWERERTSLGTKIETKTEAKQEANRLTAAIESGAFTTDTPQLATLTLNALITLYVDRAMTVTRPDAVEREETAINTIKRTEVPRIDGALVAIGAWLVADITTDTVERFRQIRATKRTITRDGEAGERIIGGPVVANRDLAFLRAVFNWAIAVGYLDKTPFKRHGQTVVKLTREIRRSRRLQPGEEERLRAECAEHIRLLMDVALETGCRLGELLTLQWSQVSFDPPHLFLPAQKTKTKTDRRIPMTARLQAMLEMRRLDDHGDQRPADHYVFGNMLGQKPGRMQKGWQDACARAKIKGLHFHDLRREAGSRWMDAGIPLSTIQRWLGHANISQTSTYLATTSAFEYEAMRRFDEARGTEAGQRPSAPIASDCILSQESRSQCDTIETDEEQENTINTDETSDEIVPGHTFNQGVPGSIPGGPTKRLEIKLAIQFNVR